MGARLIPQIPEPPARLHRGLVAPVDLEGSEPSLRRCLMSNDLQAIGFLVTIKPHY